MQTVKLSVPTEADFARSVRMMAANLAVVAGFSVDDVEDVRMAAEEGFVYSCATGPESCEISFSLDDDAFVMDFILGDAEPSEEAPDVAYAELLLSSLCDEFFISDKAACLHLVKRTGAASA